MRIIRVFPRRTKATPDDDMAFVGGPPLQLPEADAVHVSCTFTWDRPEAERLAKQWGTYYRNVQIGGPAYDAHGGDFVPGLYLRHGKVITSRGCPHNCPYCFVKRREGNLRVLLITDGWDILDNNLLACPKEHVKQVFQMLRRQKHKAMFRGGIEAQRVDDWFVNLLATIRVQCLFLALDKPHDKEPVYTAVTKLKSAGYSKRQICCYVLVGFGDDSPGKALPRLEWVKSIGAMPFAMYYRGNTDKGQTPPPEWQKIVRAYCRPAAIFAPAVAEPGAGPLFSGLT